MAKNGIVKKLLLYTFLLTAPVATVSTIRGLHDYTNNIYYDDDSLKLTEDEIEKMLDELSLELNRKLDEDDLNSLLLYAVFKNNRLREEDKEKIYNLIGLIEDNNYIDKDKAYRDLSKVRIRRIERDSQLDDFVLAQYMFPANIIDIYEDSIDHLCFFHELIHCIFFNETSKDLPAFFVEGITQILACEYFSELPYMETNSYVYEVIINKILCELTSTDCVLKAYSTGDINYVTSELAKNSSYSLEEINALINEIDTLFNTEYFEEETYNNTLSLFEDLYNYKKDDENFDKLQYLYLINLYKSLNAENRYYSYFDTIEEFGTTDKVYFNSKLKKDNVSYLYYSFNLDNVDFKEYYKRD